MLRFGEYLDSNSEVLSGGSYVSMEELPKSGLIVNFQEVLYNVKEKRRLFRDVSNYTFRNYGKVKNFTWNIAPSDIMRLTTTKSHLRYIKKRSQRLSVREVDEEVMAGRVYVLELFDWNSSSGKPIIIRGTLRLARLDNISYDVYLSKSNSTESASDIQRFLDMIAEADVIALHIDVNNLRYPGSDIMFVVDDNTKIFLDKLMTIYNRNMRDYLYKHNITLGMVLDNLDLYYCLSFGVR